MYRLGYNTNGLAHHRLPDALDLLSGLGYGGCAITLDVGQLDPFRLVPGELELVRDKARDLDLALAIETGARFLLDPARKHRPTLLEAEPSARAVRIDFLKRACDLAADLGASVVSIWSGAVPEGVTPATGDDGRGEELWDRLCGGLLEVARHADARGVRLGFEPEPGMFLERPAGYLELRRRLGGDAPALGLTLDVGHCLCTHDLPVDRVIRELAPELVHVHLDDIRGGVHDHRMFGEGDLDLPGTLSALSEVGFAGLAAVELSRDSHRGAAAAAEALGHLRRALAPR